MIKLDTIYLHVTKECNLHCKYCYFSAGKPMKNELTRAEWISVIMDIQQLNPKRIVFTGGEPLLRKDIFKLAFNLKGLNNKFQVCLTTNGTLINEDNAEKIINHFDKVRISIDGIQEINDHCRGEGNFKKTMKGFKSIIDAGGDPVAFITITSKNISFLKETLHYLLRNGIVKLHISPLKLVGRATNELMVNDKNKINRIVKDFWFDAFGLQIKRSNNIYSNCGVGKFITIDPDGSVYPCHVLTFPEFYLGNVKNKRLYLIYSKSKILKQLRGLNFEELAQNKGYFKELSRIMCLGEYIQDKVLRNELLNEMSLN